MVRDRAETDEVDGRKVDLLLVEKVTNFGTNVVPLVTKLVVVDWISSDDMPLVPWA